MKKSPKAPPAEIERQAVLSAVKALDSALRRAKRPGSVEAWDRIHDAAEAAFSAYKAIRRGEEWASYGVLHELARFLFENIEPAYGFGRRGAEIPPPKGWIRKAGELIEELGGQNPDDVADVLFELRGDQRALLEHFLAHPVTTRDEIEQSVYSGRAMQPASIDRAVDRLGEKLLELKRWTIRRSGGKIEFDGPT